MDREKLNEAAHRYAVHSPINWENFVYQDLESAFCEGAEWLMSRPLSECLTQEEITFFKSVYKSYQDSIRNGFAEGYSGCRAMEIVLGTELFNDKE